MSPLFGDAILPCPNKEVLVTQNNAETNKLE
jgi:hypothetical protein